MAAASLYFVVCPLIVLKKVEDLLPWLKPSKKIRFSRYVGVCGVGCAVAHEGFVKKEKEKSILLTTHFSIGLVFCLQVLSGAT